MEKKAARITKWLEFLVHNGVEMEVYCKREVYRITGMPLRMSRTVSIRPNAVAEFGRSSISRTFQTSELKPG